MPREILKSFRLTPFFRKDSFAHGVWRIVRSQGVQGLAGLVAIPVIVHGLGPAAYGQFSIALMIVGGLQTLDITNSLLVPYLKNNEIAKDPDARPVWQASLFNLLFLMLITAILGAIFLHGLLLLETCAFAVTYSITTLAYSLLAVNGKAAGAMATRNVVWAGTFLASALIAHLFHRPELCFLPFVAANVFVLGIYRLRWPIPLHPLTNGGVASNIRWKDIRQVIGSVVSTTFLAFSDRGMLQKLATPTHFGVYATQVDLVVKVNLIGAAISRILYPRLTNLHSTRGEQEASVFFSRVYLLMVPCLALVAICIQFAGPPIFSLLFAGRAYRAAQYLPILGAGVFLQFSGFLLVPWYNSKEWFHVSRTMFGLGAVLVLIIGPILVGIYGAIGAAWVFVIARLPHIGLTVRRLYEVRRDGLSWAPYGLGLALMTVVFLLGILASKIHA